METVLSVQNLRTYYHTQSSVVPAVDGVSLTLKKGETLGIVGESGCGKSTVARSIVGLIDRSYAEIASGEILFHGTDLLGLKPAGIAEIRGKRISMIFQNPASALNPVMTVGDQLVEVLKLHEHSLRREDYKKRCIELLTLVGIPSAESRLRDYPHQLSGGMKQRVVIAIALALNPELVIADEPTTALDVTIQAQILGLIRELRARLSLSLLLITHNMGVVAEICDRVMVMYGGVVVEEGMVREIFKDPLHPYTRSLFATMLGLGVPKSELYVIKGAVPRFAHPVTGCRFANRCDRAEERCRESEPILTPMGDTRQVRCHLYQ